MINNSKWLMAMVGAGALLASCADDFNTNDFVVQKPGDKADYEYLNQYAPLKTYLDRSAHPDFKVSAALTASDFSKKGDLYTLALSNFDEVVAGNAMKMASVVDNKGNMDFGTVSSFVSSAADAGLTVFGHTLAWHSQQPVKWFTDVLMKDKPIPVSSGATTTQETEIATVTYTDGAFPFYPMGCEPPVVDGAIHFVPTGDWSQFFITNAIALEEGNYGVYLTIKSTEEGTIKLTTQNGWSDAQQLDGNVKLTTDWSDVLVTYNGIVGGNYDFILKPETFTGTLDVKGMRVVKFEEVASGPTMHIERELVKTVTYEDGAFPFYPMGCEPPVVDGAIHFVPTGDWSQFFITNAIALEEGNYVAVLRIRSTEEGNIKLTTQNGWSDAQQLDGTVKLTTEWSDAEVEYSGIVGGNYDFILKPETFTGTLDVQSLSIYQLVEKAGPTPETVATVTYEDGGFPFYPMGCEPPVVDGAIHFVPTGDWSQFFITNAIALEEGNYSAYLTIKSTEEGNIKLTTQNGWSDAQQLDGTVKLTTDWSDVEVKFDGIVGGNYDFILKPETFTGTLDLKALKIVKWVENAGGGSVMVEKKVTENKPTLVVKSQDKKEVAWETQFWIQTSTPIHTGDSYEFSVDTRADHKASASTQVHGAPGAYQHYEAVGNITFDVEWDTFKASGTFGNDAQEGGYTIALNLNEDATANTYFFRNISLKLNGQEVVVNGDLSTDNNSAFWSKEAPSDEIVNTVIQPSISYTKLVDSNTIPLTAEEKSDTLKYAMKLWIDGMMDATEGKVKAWDLVNEAISGGGDVNGYYDLQHGVEGDETNFFWQDYFGSENYVPIVEKLAREAYARQENANPADLKLFINDYNLESDWDQNKKLKSLIYWIGVWEQNGETKIDGIGSQMHISYYENESTQNSKKAAITNMLKLMAATGKLVRISELDMGFIGADGKARDRNSLTFAQEQAMADFYQWIIGQYFAIVPVAQQYGICQWCLTDASGSLEDKGGWRNGEPVGLWYLDWSRKPAYAGWAEGLKNAK